MTNTVYPPDHLLRKWESLIIDEEQNVDVVLYEAFQAGADQELEACCEWLQDPDLNVDTYKLRAARRPKPPSLKEQALDILQYPKDFWSEDEVNTIRRALEQLDD